MIVESLFPKYLPTSERPCRDGDGQAGSGKKSEPGRPPPPLAEVGPPSVRYSASRRGMLPEGRDPAWRRAGTAGGSPALRAMSKPAQRDGSPAAPTLGERESRCWRRAWCVCVQTGCDQGLRTGIRDGVEVLTTHCGFADEPSSRRTLVDACPWRTGALHRHLHVCVGLLAGLLDL